MLEVKNLTYKYEDRTALNNISLKISKGEKIAILGNNGSGKTTFFLCCNGVYKTKNAVSYNGDFDPRTLRKNVGLVFQDADTQIIGNTVEREISFGVLNFGFSKEETEKKIDYAVKAMNLEPMRKRPTYYLSGGEKKRVTIADIIALETEIIVFDEPTASLDPANIEKFKNTINTLDKTIVISTHDIDFAYEWADRFIIFNDGSIIADGGIEIFKNDDIIKKAALRKPMLWQFMEKLGYEDYTKYPRNISEWRN